MQPNLSFNEPLQKDPIAMMEDFSEACKLFGLAVEMEMHHHLPTQGRELGQFYEAYMQACSRNGMMTDTPHAYYQGAGPGVIYTCANSADPYLRYIYDTTYKFIKHTLSFPETIQGYASGGTATPGKNFTGEIGIEGDWYSGDTTIEIVKKPEHGSLRVLSTYKKYYYIADEDYLGEDSFEVTISHVDGYSENFTVKLTVANEDTSQTESETESTTENTEPNIFPWIPIVIGAGAIAAVVGVITAIKTKKKKK